MGVGAGEDLEVGVHGEADPLQGGQVAEDQREVGGQLEAEADSEAPQLGSHLHGGQGDECVDGSDRVCYQS